MSIVVGYVDTAEGHAALAAAREETQRRGAPLVVVVSERTAHLAPDQVAARERSVAALADALAGTDHEIRVLGATGDVADDIVSVALDVSAELVVLGLRPRSPVGKLILGSNAQRVLIDAPCPVLTVKPAPPAPRG